MSLFSWLKSFFVRERSDLFHPKKRLIYTYWNGEKRVHSDPMVLYKRMSQKGGELSVDIKLSLSASKDADKGAELMLEKIRWIFEVKSYKEGGLTDGESVSLLEHFLGFCDGLKKNSRNSLTSPTETSFGSKSSTEETPPTQNGLDSGSTEKEPSTEDPPPSSTESPLP